MARFAAGCARERLGLNLTLTEDEVTVYHQYIGPGYGEPTREGMEAMRLATETEGRITDPMYTGKCLADLVRQRRIKAGETVVFWHTGGAPGLFARAELFEPKVGRTFHHQAVCQVPAGFDVTASASDGVIEAIDHQSHPFAVGVQWHPETMWDRGGNFDSLFRAFVEATSQVPQGGGRH